MLISSIELRSILIVREVLAMNVPQANKIRGCGYISP
jgi:hypothetical protein